MTEAVSIQTDSSNLCDGCDSGICRHSAALNNFHDLTQGSKTRLGLNSERRF